jgi:hypothetical protein
MFDDLDAYIAAYDLTYRHHYEMQDEYLAALSDPDIACFTWPGNKPVPTVAVAAWPNKCLRFEDFELAMLCVGDNKAFWKEALWTYHLGEVPMFTTWISSWRRRLGRPVVHGVDDNPTWHALVWRDNWKAVRDEVAVANAKHYVVDDADLPSVAEVTAETRARVKAIRYARDIRDDDSDDERLTERNTMHGEIVAITDRLARAAGWPEEPWEGGRARRPGHWSLATLQAARQIGDLTGGPWRDYIEQRSGRAARLRGDWEFTSSTES